MELTTSKHLYETTCPVARTAEIISGKWTLLIIRDLASGVKRFNQLERSLHGISPKTLSTSALYGGVDDAQAGEAAHAQPLVDHSVRVGAHAAGRGRMIDRVVRVARA